jgi:hypothetical protein
LGACKVIDREIAILKQLIEDGFVSVSYEGCGHYGYAREVCGCDPKPIVYMTDNEGHYREVIGLWDKEAVYRADLY